MYNIMFSGTPLALATGHLKTWHMLITLSNSL